MLFRVLICQHKCSSQNPQVKMSWPTRLRIRNIYRSQGKITFSETWVILLTIGPMATRSLLILAMARSVRILLEYFLFCSGLFLLYLRKVLLINSYCSLFLNMDTSQLQILPKRDSKCVIYDMLVFLPTKITITKSVWDITSHRSNLFTKHSAGPIRSGDQRVTEVEIVFGTETYCFSSITDEREFEKRAKYSNSIS